MPLLIQIQATILHWGGDVSSTNNSIQFVVDKDMHVIAFFDYKHPPEPLNQVQ